MNQNRYSTQYGFKSEKAEKYLLLFYTSIKIIDVVKISMKYSRQHIYPISAYKNSDIIIYLHTKFLSEKKAIVFLVYKIEIS